MNKTAGRHTAAGDSQHQIYMFLCSSFKESYLQMKVSIWNCVHKVALFNAMKLWVLCKAECSNNKHRSERQTCLYITGKKAAPSTTGAGRGGSGQRRRDVRWLERQAVETVNLMGSSRTCGPEAWDDLLGGECGACEYLLGLTAGHMHGCRGVFVSSMFRSGGSGGWGCPHCIGLCRAQSRGAWWLHTPRRHLQWNLQVCKAKYLLVNTIYTIKLCQADQIAPLPVSCRSNTRRQTTFHAVPTLHV